MSVRSFDAKLQRPIGVGTWTYLTVPFDANWEYGLKGQIKVKARVEGVAYRTSLLPHGDGRHYLVVNKTIRDKIGASEGSIVSVTIELDRGTRSALLPTDLKEALKHNAEVRKAFAKLPYSHQKEYLNWIEAAKKAETRLRRIEATIKRVSGGQRLKG